MYGIDLAIKKLRPNAKFVLYGPNFHEWYDPDGLEPPSWEEINEQIEKDKILTEMLANLK